MELSREPFALSDLIGRPVCDSSGRRLGRTFEVRAHWQDGGIVIDEQERFGVHQHCGSLNGPAGGAPAYAGTPAETPARASRKADTASA